MSAEIISHYDGVVTVKVSNVLTYADMMALQPSLLNLLVQMGGAKVLIVTENFQGWSQESAWDDISVMWKNDPLINKMAIVGEKKWQDLALMFTAQGLREFPIEYFAADELSQAETWLAEY